MTEKFDVIVVGAGSAGMVLAHFAAKRGARVLALEAAPEAGGTLHISTGQMSAAGTKLQKKLGINDSPAAHYDDVMRISKNTADPKLVRFAVDNAAETFDWLVDNGLKVGDDHPVLGSGHEFYKERRYYWGAEGGRSVMAVTRPIFLKDVADGKVTLKLNTPASALVQDATGRVVGVTATTKGEQPVTYYGQNIVLTTGGYASNAKLFKELNGYPQYANAAYPYSQGQGIDMVRGVGGYTRGEQNYLCSFGSILEDDNYPSKIAARPIHNPALRQPWEILVNKLGNRFVQEDHPSVDHREHALLAQPEMRMWMIFDDEIAKAAPPIAAEWNKAEQMAKFNNHPMFLKADTLEELAKKAGVDARGLAATVAQYNANLKGADPFGRTHRPLPIAKGPFYAVRLHGASISSTVGVAVDEELRVLDKANKPIPGLFAAGEMLGAGQTMGHSFAGGMMVTPAMTFGRLLGDKMLEWEKVPA